MARLEFILYSQRQYPVSSVMQPIDKKALQKSRKTAVFLGLAVVIVMLVILYMVQKTLHDPNEQLIALGLSTFVLVNLYNYHWSIQKKENKTPTMILHPLIIIFFILLHEFKISAFCCISPFNFSGFL